MKTTRYVAALCFSTLGLGCADAPTVGRTAGSVVSTAKQLQPDQLIARSLALALSDPSGRRDLLDAMRASPWTEHKLVLQEFATTASGQRIIAGAARAAGLTSAALQQVVAQLPAMDLYLPSREHRLNWEAGTNVVVGAFLESGTQAITVYDNTGRPSSYLVPGNGNAEPSRVLLVMHPAEPKTLRIGAQIAGPGSVVQERADGELGGIMTVERPNGKTESVQLASLVGPDMRAAISPAESGLRAAATMPSLYRCPDGPPPPMGKNEVRMNGYYLETGDGPFEGASELKVNAEEREPEYIGNRKSSVTLTGINLQQQYCVAQWILEKEITPGSSGRVYITAYEADATRDDLYGLLVYDFSLRNVWSQPLSYAYGGTSYSSVGTMYMSVTNWTTNYPAR